MYGVIYLNYSFSLINNNIWKLLPIFGMIAISYTLLYFGEKKVAMFTFNVVVFLFIRNLDATIYHSQ